MSLNKPATWSSVSARWYLWDGGFLAMGKSEGVIPPHSHHAIQIVVAIDGSVAIKSDRGDWRTGRGVIVRHDVEHSYDGNGATGAMIFVDPESYEGVWLQTALAEEITVVPDVRVSACASALKTFLEKPFESMEIDDLIRHCVLSLCAGAPPSRRLDDRVTKVLTAIRASDDLRMSIEDAAATVFLSPSRFAHLTRTFYQMFGMPPSVMMRGDCFEIPSPFSAAG